MLGECVRRYCGCCRVVKENWRRKGQSHSKRARQAAGGTAHEECQARRTVSGRSSQNLSHDDRNVPASREQFFDTDGCERYPKPNIQGVLISDQFVLNDADE